MTQKQQIAMRRLRGDWMDDGFIDNLADRALQVAVVDGRAYDADLYGMPEDAGRLSLDEEGNICGWGMGRSFSPDAGEVERIGGAGLFATAGKA